MKLYFVIKDGKCPWKGYDTFDDARDFANFCIAFNWTSDIEIKQLEADENGLPLQYSLSKN